MIALTVQTLRYLSPPDTLLSQISLYLEEKQEDQDELHERSLGRREASSGASGGPFDAVLSSLRDRPDIEPITLDLLRHVVSLFDRPLEPCVLSACCGSDPTAPFAATSSRLSPPFSSTYTA